MGNAGDTVTPRNCVLGSNLAACGEWVKWTRSSSSAQLRSSDPLVWKPRYCSLQRHSGALLSKAYYNLPREGGLRDDNFTSPLCAVLRELGVRRFLILGDSLSFVQVQNLFIGPGGLVSRTSVIDRSSSASDKVPGVLGCASQTEEDDDELELSQVLHRPQGAGRPAGARAHPAKLTARLTRSGCTPRPPTPRSTLPSRSSLCAPIACPLRGRGRGW